jgi:hypothetical protein
LRTRCAAASNAASPDDALAAPARGFAAVLVPDFAAVLVRDFAAVLVRFAEVPVRFAAGLRAVRLAPDLDPLLLAWGMASP